MIFIPKNLRFALPLFALLFLTWSCDEEQFVEQTQPLTEELSPSEEMPEALLASLPPATDENPTDASEDPADAVDGRPGCFRFVFPISVELDNGIILEAGNNRELRAIYQRITAAELGANFVYPFQVRLRNGVAVTISNFGNFRRLQNFCMESSGDDEERPCFRYNFPIDLVIDGETVTVNNGAEWRRAVVAAGAGARVRIVFPVTVTVASGRELTLENQQELNRLRRRCIATGDDRPCIQYLFPLRLYVDGDTIRVNNLREWREAAQTADSVSVVFPLALVFRGERIVVRNAAQLRRVLNACGHSDDHDERPCFRYVFPIDLEINGRTITVNNLREWHRAAHAAASGGTGATINIVFPIEVHFRGETLTLENIRQLQRVRNACG